MSISSKPVSIHFGTKALDAQYQATLERAATGTITPDEFPGILYREYHLSDAQGSLDIHDFGSFISIRGTEETPGMTLYLNDDGTLKNVAGTTTLTERTSLGAPEILQAAASFLRHFENTKKILTNQARERLKEMKKNGYGLDYLRDIQNWQKGPVQRVINWLKDLLK